VLLCIFSSIPGHRLGRMPFDWFDKLEHAGFFFLGSSLMGAWLLATGRWPRKWWLLPSLAAVVGLIDEAHQLMTPGRSGMDAGDWLADVLGGTLALIPVAIVAWRRRQQA
jgi:VanZ family protein